MAFKKKILISVTHGTYGHQDDGYGSLLVANGILAKGVEATLFLRGDGVYIAVKDQAPNEIGLPNNLNELADFTELGGVIKVDRLSLEDRGLVREDLVEDVEVIEREMIFDMLSKHDFCLTF